MRPRDGATDQFLIWRTRLARFLVDEGIDVAEPIPQPPTQNATTEAYATPNATQSQLKQQQAYAAARAEWQAENTYVFDVVEATLDLTGPHFRSDLKRVATFEAGSLRDGRGLLSWIATFTDLSGLEAQVKLKADYLSMRLAVGATLADLESFLEQHWDTFCNISEHTLTDSGIATYWTTLLTKLPDSPEGSHLVNVRKWIAERILDKRLVGVPVEQVHEQMVQYAKHIGLKTPSSGNMVDMVLSLGLVTEHPRR